MKMRFDQKQDALYIRFNESKYSESEELQDGVIFDYDSKGKIIAIEILDASKKLSPRFKKSFAKEKTFVEALECKCQTH